MRAAVRDTRQRRAEAPAPRRFASFPEQIADLTQQIERLEARLGEGGGGGGPAPQAAPRQDPGYGASPASGFEDKQQLPPLGVAPVPVPAYPSRQQQGAAAPVRPAPQAARRLPRQVPRGRCSTRAMARSTGANTRLPRATSSSSSKNIRPIRSRAARNIGSARRRSSAENTKPPPTAS